MSLQMVYPLLAVDSLATSGRAVPQHSNWVQTWSGPGWPLVQGVPGAAEMVFKRVAVMRIIFIFDYLLI